MDPQSRQTASTYINNLLLSRGLLRNGTPIEFAKPEEAEGGLIGTMSQVMNLVHDLILRRDVCALELIHQYSLSEAPDANETWYAQRESDSLTNLSTSLSTLRATTTSQAATIAKAAANTAALDRQLALTAAQERAARHTLRSAETRNRVLREEMVRLKASVAQVRAQCATDVRRRDGEIARLKKHLEGRRGRDSAGPGVGVVVITPGTSGRSQGMNAQVDEEGSLDLLKQETTEFLTRLAQGLSDENDALIGLVRGTLATLRSLQGLPQGPVAGIDGEVGELADDMGGFMNGPPSVDTLALDTDEVLEHLRGLLTNPSFVPLEEVELREEEIQRLREGWEKMALRWKEAMTLMDGWKKRVADTGDTINLDDLKDGLKLGNGIPSAIEARVSPAKKDKETVMDDPSILQDYGQQQENTVEEVSDVSEPSKEADMAVEETDRALSDICANARPAQEPRDVSCRRIPEENSRSINTEDELSLLDYSKEKAPKTSPANISSSRKPFQASIHG